MATAQPMPATSAPPPRKAVPVGGPDAKAAQELVVAPRTPNGESDEEPGEGLLRGPVARLPVELDVAVPVAEFRVRHLLALEPGTVIESRWSYGEDVPLAAGEVQLAWSEFEVIDSQLAVRITRLP